MNFQSSTNLDITVWFWDQLNFLFDVFLVNKMVLVGRDTYTKADILQHTLQIGLRCIAISFLFFFYFLFLFFPVDHHEDLLIF